MASTDARPIPKKNTAYRVTFPIFDADGDLVTGAAGLDSEVSKDGGTFADCTNEATELATSSGMYYLDLINSEMNADTVTVIVKTSTSGAKTTPIVVYPVAGGIKEIYSDTTIIYSDTTLIHSETTAIQSDAAAVESELILVHSETTVVASDVIVIDAALTNVHSETTAIQTDTGNIDAALTNVHSETTAIQTDTGNIYSDTTVIEAWGLGSVASDVQAAESELILVHSETTVIASDVIVIDAALTNVHSETTAIQTDANNAYSDTTVIEAWGLGSATSDTAAIESELILVHSETTATLADTGTDGVVLADNAITAAKIVAAAANKIADHIIRRSFVNACDSADGDVKSFRSLLGAIAKLINKIAVSGSTLTVYEEDDTTALGTQAITTDSGADPITALDTA